MKEDFYCSDRPQSNKEIFIEKDRKALSKNYHYEKNCFHTEIDESQFAEIANVLDNLFGDNPSSIFPSEKSILPLHLQNELSVCDRVIYDSFPAKIDKSRFNKIVKLLDNLLGDNPLSVSPCIIPSLQELADMVSVHRQTLVKWLEKEYLSKFDNPDLIKKKLWPAPGSLENINLKKTILFKMLDEQLKDYPKRKPIRIIDLNKLLGSNKLSLQKWIKEYLTNKIITENPNLDKNLAISLADDLYSEIWFSPQKNPYTYSDIELYVKNRGGTLKTTKVQFNAMEKIPTDRRIEIICEKGHLFDKRIGDLIYRGDWCSVCNEYLCQKIMGLFMDKIFGVNFRKQTFECNLRRIYGLPDGYFREIICDKNNAFKYKVHISRQSFDGYLEFIVKGIYKNGKQVEILVRVAFEYDGIQHDEYSEQYHYGDMNNFYIQRCRDIAKDEEAQFHDTIIIRLKENLDFNLKTINTFQEEIIRQFQEQTGIKLFLMPRYLFDLKSFDLNIDSSQTIDIPLSSDANQIRNKQLRISEYLRDLE